MVCEMVFLLAIYLSHDLRYAPCYDRMVCKILFETLLMVFEILSFLGDQRFGSLVSVANIWEIPHVTMLDGTVCA